jgi:hypothetical protein
MMGPLVVLVTLVAAGVTAVPAPQAELIENLRRGGYVLVMRHAHAPREARRRSRRIATMCGSSDSWTRPGVRARRPWATRFRAQRIPIGAVFSSPTCRALQTVKRARLGDPTIVDQVGLTHDIAKCSRSAAVRWGKFRRIGR